MCALPVPADSDLIVTAHFAPRHALFFDPPVSARRVEADGGAAVKSGEVFDAGTTLVFSANAPNGARALGWRKDGAPFPACDGADECQMTVSADGLWAAADYGVSVRYAHRAGGERHRGQCVPTAYRRRLRIFPVGKFRNDDDLILEILYPRAGGDFTPSGASVFSRDFRKGGRRKKSLAGVDRSGRRFNPRPARVATAARRHRLLKCDEPHRFPILMI